MDQIYRNADKVLVWLGDSDASADVAFNVMNHIPLSHATVDEAIDRGSFTNITSPQWAHVLNLFDRDYFRRLWVRCFCSVHRERVDTDPKPNR